MDLGLSVPAIVALSPVLGVVAAVVRMTSPGPAFFRQERVGRDGRSFRIHKFRTMVDRHDGVTVSSTGDPRVTRTGRVLRRTKLDELPQLIDVIRGDMALVGPRPEVPEYVEYWSPADREIILSVRPGITDPASIRFRHEADLLADAPSPRQYYIDVLIPQKVALYREYVDQRTVRGDVGIIVATLRTLFPARRLNGPRSSSSATTEA